MTPNICVTTKPHPVIDDGRLKLHHGVQSLVSLLLPVDSISLLSPRPQAPRRPEGGVGGVPGEDLVTLFTL